MNTRFSKDRAFTLLELLIVIACTGILLCISSLSLAGTMRHIELHKESERLLSTLQSLAIKTRQIEKNILFTITPDSYSARSEELGFLSYHLPLAVHFVRKKPAEIHFYTSGVCSPFTFKLSDDKQICTVTLSLRCKSKILCG